MGVIGSFGTINFEVSAKQIKTFKEFNRTGQARYERQMILGSKPLPEFTGPDLDELSISIKLSKYLNVNVDNEISKLRSMMNKGEAHSFILGKKNISPNYWVIEKINEMDVQIDSKGNITSANVQVNFLEYPKPAGASTKTTSKTVSAASANKNVSKSNHIGVVTVKAAQLNMRAGPSLKSKILKVTKKGDAYRVYGTQKTDITWYKLGAGKFISANSTYVSFKKA